MARSQGVKEIIQLSYVDGKLVRETVVKRVVYKRAVDGTLYVRDHDRQRNVKVYPDGKLVVWYETKTLGAIGWERLIERWGGG